MHSFDTKIPRGECFAILRVRLVGKVGGSRETQTRPEATWKSHDRGSRVSNRSKQRFSSMARLFRGTQAREIKRWIFYEPRFLAPPRAATHSVGHLSRGTGRKVDEGGSIASSITEITHLFLERKLTRSTNVSKKRQEENCVFINNFLLWWISNPNSFARKLCFWSAR